MPPESSPRPQPTGAPGQSSLATGWPQASPAYARAALASTCSAPPPPARAAARERSAHQGHSHSARQAKGKQPPRAAWAIAVEDLDEAGRATARMDAAAAIATEATHGPKPPARARQPATPGK